MGSAPLILPSEGAMTSFALEAINRSVTDVASKAKHTRALLAYVMVLKSPLTHLYLIVFIQSIERVILVRWHRGVV